MSEWTRQPWDRRARETDRQWAAFCAYRDMARHERSHVRVAKALGLSEAGGRIGTWAKEHDWTTRVAAFDAEADSLFLEEMASRRMELLREHATRTARLSAVISRRIAALEEGDAAERADPRDLDALSRANKQSIEAERISVGLPATVREQREVGSDGPKVVVLSGPLSEAIATQDGLETPPRLALTAGGD